jgi:methylase of polypeptide subunit release factors
MNAHPIIQWTEGGQTHSARWRSEAGVTPHKRVAIADEQMPADVAYRLACEGTALLWRGDFQNARQLLIALARRVDEKARKARREGTAPNAPKTKPVQTKPPRQKNRAASAATTSTTLTIDAFNLHRLAQSQRARTLGMLLIPLASDYMVPLKRAPNLQRACLEAYGAPNVDAAGNDMVAQDSLVSLRELLGLVGAHEWRKKGVDVPALGESIHPHYGVFAPVRNEYVNLVASAPFPSLVPALTPSGKPSKAKPKPIELAFDIGTGTGVLAAVLAQRGIKRIIATDMDPRALVCARENMSRLDLTAQVELVQANLFPDSREGHAALIVCNPPWIPARPSAPIESAIYDPDSQMLRGFVAGLAAHLAPGGEGWLILSDIAEHLGLRTREELLGYFEKGGLTVIGRLEVRPTHPKATDSNDPLHAARAAEVTSLWRLGAS